MEEGTTSSTTQIVPKVVEDDTSTNGKFKKLVLKSIPLLIFAALTVHFGLATDYFISIEGGYVRHTCCDGYGFLIILYAFICFGYAYAYLYQPLLSKRMNTAVYKPIRRVWKVLFKKRYTVWAVYVVILAAIIIFLILDAWGNERRLIPIAGLVLFFLFGYICSKHRSKINWHIIIRGFFMQFIFGLLTLRWETGRAIFDCAGNKVSTFLGYARNGSAFVYGEDLVLINPVFAFEAISTIYFLGFMINILYHIGVMQKVVVNLGLFLRSILGTSICESVNSAANIFLGQDAFVNSAYLSLYNASILFSATPPKRMEVETESSKQFLFRQPEISEQKSVNETGYLVAVLSEAPLLLKPYLADLTASELHAVMTAGFASVSGTVLAAYISYGANPAHLITASVMAAPAGLVYSKLMYPEVEATAATKESIALTKSEFSSVLDAASQGASQATQIVLGIIANLIAFIATVYFINGVLSWMGGLVGFTEAHELWTIDLIVGYVFTPISFLMGVEWKECQDVGKLIGIKMMVNEFAAFSKFKEMVDLSARSKVIATFAICGFANPGSIGIMISALGSLIPQKSSVVTAVVFRAFISGSVVCFTTACIAGMLTV